MIMTILLIEFFAGYFLSLAKIKAKTKIQEAEIYALFIVIAGLIALVFSYIFFIFKIGKIPLIFILFITLILFFYLYIRINKKNPNKTGLILFILFTLILIYITVFFRIGGENNDIRFDLITDIKNLFNPNEVKRLGHFMLNIYMFIPLGFIYTFSNKKFDTFKSMFAGLFLSSCIETTQLVFAMGECDLMDIIGNGLGFFVGIIIYKIVKKFIKRRE
jgi:glycopeptide antibiotics resistance protein